MENIEIHFVTYNNYNPYSYYYYYLNLLLIQKYKFNTNY